jgi:cysteine desulfurase
MSEDSVAGPVIYLDNNATTRVADEVYDALNPFLRETYFNPSSMYEAAHAPGDALEAARRTICGFLNAGNPKQVLFTSCATESNNTAIYGAIRANPGRRHIITTKVEHPAVLGVCEDLARNGFDVTFLPVDTRGILDTAEFVKALTPQTLLVSIMHANNETGVIFPIEQLSRLTKETDPSILFHTDATQSAGHLPLDMKGNLKNIDMLSFSGHKMHAPKGVGVLYIRRGTPCRPYMIGGHQEDSRRAGTENVAFIVGMAKACELAAAHREDEDRVREMRDRLEAGILERIPSTEVNGQGAARLPNTLNVAFHYIEGEGILYQLSNYGICASSGSACTSGSLEPSHVLLAMDVPFTAVHGSVRFSLSRYTTDEEVDRVIEVMPGIVRNLRNLSPYWDVENDRPRPDALTDLS